MHAGEAISIIYVFLTPNLTFIDHCVILITFQAKIWDIQIPLNQVTSYMANKEIKIICLSST